jgi:hypothetical protein
LVVVLIVVLVVAAATATKPVRAALGAKMSPKTGFWAPIRLAEFKRLGHTNHQPSPTRPLRRALPLATTCSAPLDHRGDGGS